MDSLNILNRLIAVLFTAAYIYQAAYILIALLPGKKRTPGKGSEGNRYAVLICARNEENVIGDLLDSIRSQTYPDELIDVYVMADNCTDATAETAACRGAAVFTREDTVNVGKGYALDVLMKEIRRTAAGHYDGYFVFDADNILASDYIEMMDRTFAQGYDIVTGYRNSKNYGSNWISAGYALWFMRESRYLNYARSRIGSSCTVSGTGFMFSGEIADEMDGWPYHTLTEDLEFSADQISKGRRAGFCMEAELFDEQPVDLRQSWRQRMRWSRGYLQVLGRRGGQLFEGILRGDFSCFDCAMSIMPAFLLSVVSVVCNLVCGAAGLINGESVMSVISPALYGLGYSYAVLFAVGSLTATTEWYHIHTSTVKKVMYLFTFPLFMFTYVPVAISSLFVNTGWKPITHTFSSGKLKNMGIKGVL